VRVTAGLVVVALVAVVIVCVQQVWRVSDDVEAALTVPGEFWRDEVTIVSADDKRVTLAIKPGGPTWLRAGDVWGLDWGKGWGQVTEVLDETGEGEDLQVTRTLKVLGGRPPEDGVVARYTREGYPRDARRVFEGVRTVDLNTRPAWFVPGKRKTWAILVHGRGAARSEMFRLMETTVAMGLPSLDIGYRADPENGGGRAHLGATEWEDLEAAVRLARERGADKVVLLGASMGGSIIATFMKRSLLTPAVAAIVLDAPLLDVRAAIERRESTSDLVPGLPLPSFLSRLGLRLAESRLDQDFDDVDQLADDSWVKVPVLVMHGESDPDVPVTSSEALAQEQPDRVELHVVKGAGHVESWNFGPARYDAWVRSFLSPIAS
jgi:alpha-beta hydrolase superfamily lysophospholipase